MTCGFISETNCERSRIVNNFMSNNFFKTQFCNLHHPSAGVIFKFIMDGIYTTSVPSEQLSNSHPSLRQAKI